MHEAIPPIGLAFWRWALASALVLPFVWRPLLAGWSVLREHFAKMLVLALLGVSGFNTFVYLGLQTTTATNSVLIQSTLPLLILPLNWLLFRATVGGRDMISIALSLAGVFFIMTAGEPWRLAEVDWNRGDFWVFGAALIWALYSVLLRWRPPELDPRAFLGFTLAAGCLILLPFYIAETLAGMPVHWNPSVVLTVAYVAVFPSALAYLFWNRGVAAIGANAAGHFIHLMPVFGSIMAVTFLGERFAWFHAVGAVLVATGIWLTIQRKADSNS